MLRPGLAEEDTTIVEQAHVETGEEEVVQVAIETSTGTTEI